MTANPQGPVRAVPEDLLFFKLKDLITEQSEGEWDEAMIVRDAHHFANNLRPLLAAAPSPAAPEGVEGWREIAEYSGCGPVLVSTAPDSPKYLASDPVTAFRDAAGVWRCLGSIGGSEPLALQPTHFAPMPKRPTLAPVPLADGGR